MSANDDSKEMTLAGGAPPTPPTPPVPPCCPDAPQMRARVLLRGVVALLGDPRQQQCEKTRKALRRLLVSKDGLRPVRKHLRPGLYTAVATRLGESLEMLGRVPGHQAALNQLRQVVSHLEEIIGS